MHLENGNMTTGVFFHEVFRGKEWPMIGDKFRNFPAVMSRALALPGVKLLVPNKVPQDLLLQVHSPDLIRDLNQAWYRDGALYSAGGCVQAVEAILSGRLENALVFAVAAGHHAERAFAWGGTYASCAGPAVLRAREISGPARFAIIDTDRHHGNGTRDIFRDDPNVLHVCFCHQNRIEGDGTKVCVNVVRPMTDEGYLAAVREAFAPRLVEFGPDLIFHNLGHDTCDFDYGDLGLTRDFFPRLVREVSEWAREVCRGRYVVVTQGGKLAEVAEYIFPRIIEILAGE